MTRVLAVDAGQSTGLAVVDFVEVGPPTILRIEQFVEDVSTTVTHIEDACSLGTDVIVAERFDLRPHNKFVADLTPVEINGALKYVFGDYFIVWQTPAQAKGLVKDQVLKNLGMWPTGKTVGQKDANDARDALRHAIHYGATVLKHQPTLQLGWPHES